MNQSVLSINSKPKENIIASDDGNEKFNLVTKACLAVIFICAALVGILPTMILGIVVLAACLPLLSTKDIYLVYPVMIFYHIQFGQIFGVSVSSLFFVIFLLFTFLQGNDLKINTSFGAPFALFVLYCIIVIAPDNMNRALLGIFDTFCVMVLVTQYLKKQSCLKKFFKVFALIALVAFFTGTQVETSFASGIIVDGEFVELVRNCATFYDPNYMGFFFTVAIFATVTLKLFHPVFRIALIISLYAMLLSTLSITAIVVNALMWFLYLVITRKITPKVALIVILVIAVFLGLFSYGKTHPDMPIFGMLATRIGARFEGIESIESENIADITSGRTELAGTHFNYFMNLPVWRMIVGMNAASSMKTDLDGFRMAGHNEYVDWLLNVGIIGTMIMLWFLLKRLSAAFKDYRETKSSESLCILFSKFVWMFYAFTLTLYGDFRFLFALLL